MATLTPSDPNAYTTLLSGYYWTGVGLTPDAPPVASPIVVTFSFPTTLPSSDLTVPGFTAASNASFTAFSSAEQAQAISAMSEWAAASGIVFVQVAPGQGDINFSNIDFSKLASPSTDGGMAFNPGGDWNGFSVGNNTGYFTSDLNYGGDVFMNALDQSSVDGTVAYDTLLHEIGHAIGLKHPEQTEVPYGNGIDENVLTSNDPSLTIMSTLGDGGGASGHLKTLDMQAAAAIYGPAGTGEVITSPAGGAGSPTVSTWNSGTETLTQNTLTGSTVSGSNSVSNWTWNPATQTLTQTAVGANETLYGTSVNDVITAAGGTNYLFGLDGTNTLTGGSGTNYLYGGSGQNTLIGNGATDNFFVFSTNTTVIENNAASTAGVTSTVSFTLPTHVDYLYVYGSPGLVATANNDANVTMYGDGTYATTLIAGSGADVMTGGAGNDTFIAGTGADLMFGNGGANTFVFNSLADSNVTGAGYIGDFVEGVDKIDLTGIAKTFGQPLTFIGTNAFQANDPGQVSTHVDSFGVTYLELDTSNAAASNLEIKIYDGGVALQAQDIVMACYCEGTRILTEAGERPVEALAIGDRVVTRAGLLRPIKWIGTRAYEGTFANGNRKVLPVCFKAGSLAPDVPRRDLWVSPNHALFIDGLLIQAEDLVNNRSVVQAGEIDTVRYFHIELDSHDVVLAEGAWSETFVDDNSRMMFHNVADYYRRYPQALDAAARYCAPRVSEGYELQMIRDRLEARACEEEFIAQPRVGRQSAIQ